MGQLLFWKSNWVKDFENVLLKKFFIIKGQHFINIQKFTAKWLTLNLVIFSRGSILNLDFQSVYILMEKSRGGVLYDLSYPRFLLTKQPQMIYHINEDLLCDLWKVVFNCSLNNFSQCNCRKGLSWTCFTPLLIPVENQS